MSVSDKQFKAFVSGGLAGMCAKTTVAPLDRMKILLQAQNVHYKNLGVWSGLKAIVKNESLTALYKGNGVQMIRIFPFAATQFTTFDLYKKSFSRLLGTDTIIGAFAVKFGAGALAGVTAVTLTFPLDTIRARLAFQVKGEHKYKGIVHAATTIFRNEGGLTALYRGFLPALCEKIPNAGCTFYCFETLKRVCRDFFPQYTCVASDHPTGGLILTVPANLTCGAVSGAFAQTVSYPLDVTRRRMQLALMNPETAKFGQGMWATLKLTYRENGIAKGLYRGMSINYYRACPMTAVSFSMNEFLKKSFGLDTRV